MSEVMERVEVRIAGLVQRVGFRHFTTQQARRLGVGGWVRNESDGSVCVVAEGPHDALEQMLGRLKTGPAGKMEISGLTVPSIRGSAATKKKSICQFRLSQSSMHLQ